MEIYIKNYDNVIKEIYRQMTTVFNIGRWNDLRVIKIIKQISKVFITLCLLEKNMCTIENPRMVCSFTSTIHLSTYSQTSSTVFMSDIWLK